MDHRTKGPLIAAHDNSPREEHRRCERVLAVELRPQKFGFVVFEEATRLMDWGVRSTIDRRSRRRVIAHNAIGRLLDLYKPSVVVMRQSAKSPSTTYARHVVAEIIRGEARRRTMRSRAIRAQDMRRFYAKLGCTTKYEIASLVAKRFEELAWNVPPKRKAWQQEYYRTCIFDAAALGYFFMSIAAPRH